MRNGFSLPAFLLILLSFGVTAAAADAPPLRLWLKDGSYIDGTLDASGDRDLVGLKSDLFRKPVYFDVRAIRSVAGEVSSDDQLSDHFFLIEGGTRISGRLKQWTDDRVVIQSPSLGEVRLARGLLRAIEASEDGGKRLYAGPRSMDDWKILDDAKNWRFAAGSLSALNKGARAVADVSLPDKFRLSLAMSWEGRADFVLSLGCNQPKQAPQVQPAPGQRVAPIAKVANDGAAVRLEMWDAQLAIVREIGNLADIAVLPLDDGLSRFEMTFYVDQVAGLVAVYSSRGRLLEKIQVADDKGKARSFAMLENHGKEVSLDRFGVFSWDGHLPSSTEYPESYVLDKADNVLRGNIQGFDPKTGMLKVFDLQGKDAELALAQLRRVVVKPTASEDTDAKADSKTAEGPDARETPDRSRLIEIEFADSSRVIGTLACSRGAFEVRADGIEDPINCAPDKVVAILGSETRFTSAELPNIVGTISSDAASLTGCLLDNPNPEGDAVLIWQSWASPTASPISRTATGSISYPRPRRTQAVRAKRVAPQQQSGLGVLLGGIFGGGQAPKPAETDSRPAATEGFEIVFRTGDTVDGVVDQIDARGVTFQSDETSTKLVPHEQMDSLVLNPLISKVKFDAEQMKRLMTVPRSMKNDPPTHLFLATTGDYLRGRLIGVDRENVSIEVRLQVKEIPRAKVARIIWLHERPWLETDANGEGQGNDNEIKDPNDSSKVFLVHAVRPDKRGVTFQPKKLVDGKLSGESDLLGQCSVSLDSIQSLLFGTDVGREALQLRKETWALSLATLPKVYQESADGDGPAMGLESPLVGRDAPGIQLDTIDGAPFDLQKLRGNVVVLDFWASWCGPCIQTMPEVDRIVEEFDKDDIELVAVNLQDSVERAKLAVERMNLNATVIMDVDGEAGRYYDARAIPQTVIVDREGKITHLFVGGGTKFLDQFATALKEVVSGKTAEQETAE